MSDPTTRLGAIARWLQQEDDELLYTPDGVRSLPMACVSTSTLEYAHGWLYDRITVRPLPPHIYGAPGFQADCVVDGIDYHARAPSAEEACAELIAFMVQERVRVCYAGEAGQRVFLHHRRTPSWVDVRGIGQDSLPFQPCRTEYPATLCPCGEIRVEWCMA